MRNRILAMSTLCLVLVALTMMAAKQQPTPTPPTSCTAICFSYQNNVRTERSAAFKNSYGLYLSPLDNRVVARISVEGNDTKPHLPPVDDELHLQVNGKDLWAVIYPDDPAGGKPAAFKQDSLSKEGNTVSLIYKNTAGQDAHFFAKLGGLAFCTNNEGICKSYKEGLTWPDTGIVKRAVAAGGTGSVDTAKVWRSILANPNLAGPSGPGCKCTDPPLVDAGDK